MLTNISDKINSINRTLGRLFAWLTFAMVLLMFANVISRYLFDINLVWQQERVGFMHAIVFLGASGYTLLSDKHVRVDVIYHNLSTQKKAIVNLVGTILFLLPVAFAISYLSADFIIHSWQLQEASAEYNGIKGVFVLKTFIWVFSGSLILQGFSIILRSLILLKKT